MDWDRRGKQEPTCTHVHAYCVLKVDQTQHKLQTTKNHVCIKKTIGERYNSYALILLYTHVHVTENQLIIAPEI